MDARAPPIPKLTKDNGSSWLLAIRSGLMHTGLWDVIDQPASASQDQDKWLQTLDGFSYDSSTATPSSGPSTSTSDDAQTSDAQARVAARTRGNLMKALGYMTAHIEPTMYTRYSRFTSPSALYRAVYDETILQDKYQDHTILTSLMQIKQDRKESVYEYFQRGRDLATRLANIQKPQTQAACMTYLLRGLVDELAEEKVKWLDPAKASELEFWVVLHSVEHREHHIKSFAPKPNATALFTQGRSSDKGKGKPGKKVTPKGQALVCLFCDGPHDVSMCYRLTQYKKGIQPPPPQQPAPRVQFALRAQQPAPRQQHQAPGLQHRPAAALVASLSPQDRAELVAELMQQVHL